MVYAIFKWDSESPWCAIPYALYERREYHPDEITELFDNLPESISWVNRYGNTAYVAQ